jgi:hypothetical protein
MSSPSTASAETPTRASGPGKSRWRALGGATLVALLAIILLAAHAHWEHPEGGGFALTSLPGFDAYVYAAMAERPGVFTVAPWGYRILAPTLAHALIPSRPLRAFRRITFVTLTAAAVLLFAFARRVGFRAPAALVGMVAFCVSSPVGEALKSPFAGEGLAVALETCLLLGVASGASLPCLLLLTALGLLTKDVFLFFVPLAYVPLRRRLDRRGAVAATAVLVLLAIGVNAALRLYWTPQIHTPHPILDRRLLHDFLGALRAEGSHPFTASLLAGIVPAALVGALRRAARPFLLRYGYLAAITLALPFLAWLNVPATHVFSFFGDVPRLHIYALPLLIPLALLALDHIWHVFDGPPATAWETPRLVRWGLAGAAVLAVALPFLAADTYRRYPLHVRREGFQVFLACRTSPRVAERLARGESVELTSQVSDAEPPGSPARRRWYLMEGWPDGAVFGTGDFVLQETPGVLLIPCLGRQSLTVDARVRATRPSTLSATINDQLLPPVTLAEGYTSAQWALPARALFRGDNVLQLTIRDGGPVVFESLTLRPGGSAR